MSKKKDKHSNFNSARGGCLVVLQRQGRGYLPIASSVAALGLDLQTDRSGKT